MLTTRIPANTSAMILQIALAVVGLAAAAAGAYAHGRHAHARPQRATPEELAAFQAAKPAFERHCFRCHTTAGKKSKPKALKHLAMDQYPFGGHHAGEIGGMVRKVLGADGNSKVTMPSDDPGAVTGDDLTKIMAWADAFNHAHPDASTTTKEMTHAH